MSELVALAAKVEGAEGPSRELDAEIAAGLKIVPQFDPTIYILPLEYKTNERETGRVEIVVVHADGSRRTIHSRPAPPYTASIDAALTLVPEGEDWFVAKHHKGPGYASAVGGKTQKTCSAATPALALCAAALRARAAALRDNGGVG